MTSPVPDSEPTTDSRFTTGFIYDVHRVLQEHGYRPPKVGVDGDTSARDQAYGALATHLYRLVRAFEGIEQPALFPLPKET